MWTPTPPTLSFIIFRSFVARFAMKMALLDHKILICPALLKIKRLYSLIRSMLASLMTGNSRSTDKVGQMDQ